MKSITTILLFSLAVVFSAQVVVGQGYTFKVMASSNKPMLKVGNKVLATGSSLQTTDQVVVPASGYISLAHKTGGTVQISKAGTYNVAELEKNMLAAKNSASGKLANYVINEVSKGQNDNINQKKYAYMNVTGSVERATKSIINVYLPKVSKVFDNKVFISWESVLNNKNYEITLLNEFNEVVKKISTQDTFVVVDFEDKAIKSHDLISVTMLAKETKLLIAGDNGFGLNKTDANETANFKKMYENFKKENATEANTAFAKLAEAMFFEEHGYFIDALRCYNEAVKAAGTESEPYAIALDQFRIRKSIGTVKDPEEVSRNK